MKQTLNMTSHIQISSTNELREFKNCIKLGAERGDKRECGGMEGGNMNLTKTHYIHCEILKHQIFKKIMID